MTSRSSKGDGALGHGGRACRRSRALARRRAPTIRRRISCMRRCASCSATMWRRRARSSRPSGCASTSPIRSRSRAAEIEAVEDIANRVVLENAEVTTRLMSLDDARGLGRARAVRRKIWRRSARRRAWARIEDGGDHERAYSVELCGGTHVAAHRRHRPHHHRRRKRGRRGRAPHRGEDRATRRASSSTPKPRACADLAALLRAPARRGGRAARGAASTIGASSSASSPRPGASSRWAAVGRREPRPRDVGGVKFYARAVTRRRHEGPEVARRRGQAERRLGRRRHRRRERGRQGEHRRRA